MSPSGGKWRTSWRGKVAASDTTSIIGSGESNHLAGDQSLDAAHLICRSIRKGVQVELRRDARLQEQ